MIDPKTLRSRPGTDEDRRLIIPNLDPISRVVYEMIRATKPSTNPAESTVVFYDDGGRGWTETEAENFRSYIQKAVVALRLYDPNWSSAVGKMHSYGYSPAVNGDDQWIGIFTRKK